MSKNTDFEFEKYDRYWGSCENVKKIMDQCPYCGSKLLLSHLPDYKNLFVPETSRCIDCGKGSKKIIHILN